MKAPLLMVTVIGSQLTAAAASGPPELNVERLCKARSASDRLMREPEHQKVPDCIREEGDAKQDLVKMWSKTDRSIRARCVSEAVALGTRSYLDFLACLQLTDDIRSAEKESNGNRTRK
jgi:hypothetical protein